MVRLFFQTFRSRSFLSQLWINSLLSETRKNSFLDVVMMGNYQWLIPKAVPGGRGMYLSPSRGRSTIAIQSIPDVFFHPGSNCIVFVFMETRFVTRYFGENAYVCVLQSNNVKRYSQT